MNLLDVFLELEDSYLQESYLDRQTLIADILKAGYKYKFEKYTDNQLYRIWQWTQRQQAKKSVANKDSTEFAFEMTYDYCETCGRELNPLGECPICDLGDDSIYDDLEESTSCLKLAEWKSVTQPINTSTAQQSQTAPSSHTPVQLIPPSQSMTSAQGSNKNIVTIVYDTKAHKLRARSDDGIHGEANVAFPNSLRNQEGQQYEVDSLIWNGKNYRVSGNIKPVNSVSNTQNNINETINKENPEMNFTNVFEELSRLYEDEEVEIEVTEDEVAEVPTEATTEEPAQLVLECTKCGALVIKEKTDVTVDETTDLANVEDTCAFCEEKEGFKVLGELLFYTVDEDSEDFKESIDPEAPNQNVQDVASETSPEAPAPDAPEADNDPGTPTNDKDSAEVTESVLAESSRIFVSNKIQQYINSEREKYKENGEVLSDEDALKIHADVIKKFPKVDNIPNIYPLLQKFIKTGKTDENLWWSDVDTVHLENYNSKVDK